MKLGIATRRGAVKKAEIGAVALLIALVAGVVVYGFVWVPSSSVALPSFEGLHFIFIGLQPASTTTVYVGNAIASQICIDNAKSCPFVQSAPTNGNVVQTSAGSYSWVYSQTDAALTLCQPGPTAPSCVHVDIKPAVQNPVLVQPISYIARAAGYQVEGNVYLTQMQLTLGQPQGNDINRQFKGDILWFAIFSEGWNNVNENGPINGATWTTPILTEFLGAPTPPGQSGTPANNYYTTPGTSSGIEPITLYSTPQTTSAFGNLLSSPSTVGAVNSTLASRQEVFPDTQMLQYGFFPVVLTDFGSYGCGNFGLNNAECDNTLQLNFETYTLQLGTYTWTNPITQSQTTQQNNCIGVGCISNPIAWVSNPYFWVIVALVIVAVVFVVWVAVKAVDVWVKAK